MDRQLQVFFFFSSRRRHTRWNCDWVQTCALPIFGAGRYVERLENKVKRHAPVFCGNGADMPAAAKYTQKFLLELRDVRSLDQLFLVAALGDRSEERRVGKECRSRWST